MAETAEKITTVCPSCKKRFSVRPEMRGRKVRCNCQTVFVVESESGGEYELATPDAAPRNVIAAPAYPARSMVEPGVNCSNHPEAPATQRCKNCNVPICATCVFSFPNGMHLCPACATDTTVRLSSARRLRAGIALAMATWVTLVFVIIFLGLLPEPKSKEEVSLLGLGVMALGWLPSIIGICFALTSIDRRRGNTPVVWVAVVWNAVLCAGWVLLVILGMMRS